MLRKYKYICLVFAVLLLVGVTQPAHAVLNAVGPTSGVNGYPLWYQDGAPNLLSLDLCLATTVSPAPPGPAGAFFMCNLLADGLGYDPAVNPVPVFPTNWPLETFYYSADAKITVPSGGGGGRTTVATYRASVEASFLLGAKTPGQQITFSQFRYKIDVPANGGGTYTVTHPYGVETYTGVGTGPGAINKVFRVGGVAANSFTDPLSGTVGPYLSRVAGPIVIGGLTFIGDPNLPSTVTGGPHGNKFMVDGPNINPDPAAVNPNHIETDQIGLTGLVTGGVVPTPLAVTATYSRGLTSGVVDVHATSSHLATVDVSGGANLPPGAIPMTEDPITPGSFFVHIVLADASVLPLPPATITVTAQGGAGTGLTTLTPSLIDVVTITQAAFNPTAQTLTIQAASSDKGATPPILTVPSLGIVPMPTLTPNAVGVPTVVIPMASPPASVTVLSSSLGSATASVQTVVPAEKLKVTSATFSKKTATWHVQGHTTVNGATIRIFNSPDLTKPMLGKVQANGLGLFNFILRGAKGTKLPHKPPLISVSSSGKGKLMNKRVRMLP